MIDLVLAVHLAATAAMTGLIWFVQVVHYRLFPAVGEDSFVDYEAQHVARTSWVVGPFMAIEGITALWIMALPGPELGRVLPAVGLVLLGAVHASTVLLQVPRHRRLADGFVPAVSESLTVTNWIRTMGWSARCVVAIAMVLSLTG